MKLGGKGAANTRTITVPSKVWANFGGQIIFGNFLYRNMNRMIEFSINFISIKFLIKILNVLLVIDIIISHVPILFRTYHY